MPPLEPAYSLWCLCSRVRFLAIPGEISAQFLMLSYFSRLCILCLFACAIWSVKTFFRLVVMVRSGESGAVAYSQLLRMNNNFNGVFFLSEIVSVSCFADQMFAFLHTYLARATDTNPFPVLIQAWGIWQFIVGVLILIHSLRWYVSSVLHRKHTELPHQSCEKN